MKTLVLAVLIVLAQTGPPSPRKTASHASKNDKQGHQQSIGEKAPALEALAAKESPPAGASHTASSKNPEQPHESTVKITEFPKWSIWEWIGWTAGVLLAIAGVAGVLVATHTLVAIQRQARIMLQQTRIIRASVSAARANAKSAAENAAAASDAAGSAKRNIEIQILKERGRIRVEVEPLDMGGLVPWVAVKYRVISYGPTVAIITDTMAELVYGNSRNDLPHSTLPSGMGIPKILSPGEKIERSANCWNKPTDPLAGIKSREAFLHFSGFVKYKDVFGNDRETTFRYLWDVTDLPSLGKKGENFAMWLRQGKPEENHET